MFTLPFARGLLVWALLLGVAPAVSASTLVIDFESLSDLEPITNQFAAQGITFSNAVAAKADFAGGSLNTFDVPPFSGTNVAVDSGGAMSISFASPIDFFSGHFTYFTTLTLEAFNGATSLGSVSSAFGDNTLSSGNPPNELLSFLSPGQITRVIITGFANGDSFALDDVRIQRTDVPEPATLVTLLLGLGVLAARRSRARLH